MKNYIMAILLCISTLGIAQETTAKRTITTYGSVAIDANEKLYKTDVTLSLENSYYAENPCTTLEELKAKYFDVERISSAFLIILFKAVKSFAPSLNFFNQFSKFNLK